MKTKLVHSKQFQSKLTAYSATATVALLAAPAIADAQSTIQDITSITPGSTLSLPRNGGYKGQTFTAGSFHVSMRGINATRNHGNTYTGIARIGISNGANNVPVIGNGVFAELFGLGASIHGNSAGTGLAHGLQNSNNLGVRSGNFQPPPNGAVTGYIGFKLNQHAHTYYGWLRVKVEADAIGNPDEISLVAKNGDPDIYGAFGLKSSDITAGEITAEATPEPSATALGGLGLLALGARGVRELRRRRKENPSTTAHRQSV